MLTFKFTYFTLEQPNKKIRKPFARKIQILTVGEQRAKVMGKTTVVNIFKKGKEAYAFISCDEDYKNLLAHENKY